MKRSLMLLTFSALLALAVFAPVSPAKSYSQKSLGSIQKISGDYGYGYPNSGRMKVRDLRTGKVREVAVPLDPELNDMPSEYNGSASAFTSRFGAQTPDNLWFVRPGSAPKLLATVARTGSTWCSQFNQIRTLGMNSSNAVVAAFMRYDAPTERGCPLDASVSWLVLLRPDGYTATIDTPQQFRQNLYMAIAARGTRILFQKDGVNTSHFTVFDHVKKQIVWEGDRPRVGQAELLADDTIGSSFITDDGPGWIERFNFRSGKVVHLNLKADSWAQFCGSNFAVRSGGKITLHTDRGRRVLMREKKNSSLNIVTCSRSYLLAVRYQGPTAPVESTYRLFDIRKFR